MVLPYDKSQITMIYAGPSKPGEAREAQPTVK